MKSRERKLCIFSNLNQKLGLNSNWKPNLFSSEYTYKGLEVKEFSKFATNKIWFLKILKIHEIEIEDGCEAP